MTRKTKRSTRKKSKERVPKAIREQTWLKSFGKVYEHSCYIKWIEGREERWLSGWRPQDGG